MAAPIPTVAPFLITSSAGSIVEVFTGPGPVPNLIDANGIKTFVTAGQAIELDTAYITATVGETFINAALQTYILGPLVAHSTASSQASTSQATAPSGAASSSIPTESHGSSLNGGAITGIVIGALAALGVFGFACWYLGRRTKSRRAKNEDSAPEGADTSHEQKEIIRDTPKRQERSELDGTPVSELPGEGRMEELPGHEGPQYASGKT